MPAVSYGNIPGFAEEMRHLGDCYMQGIEGHSKDAGRAYKYYEAAAVHGCVRMLVPLRRRVHFSFSCLC